jgi:hypothetical protein
MACRVHGHRLSGYHLTRQNNFVGVRVGWQKTGIRNGRVCGFQGKRVEYYTISLNDDKPIPAGRRYFQPYFRAAYVFYGQGQWFHSPGYRIASLAAGTYEKNCKTTSEEYA